MTVRLITGPVARLPERLARCLLAAGRAVPVAGTTPERRVMAPKETR